jgi:multiple sugar transport system permease protein
VTISGPTAPAGATVAAPDPAQHDQKYRRGQSSRAREDRRTGYLLISPTVIIVFAMVVLPILWTVSLAFQRVRLINLRQTGFFGQYTVDNFAAVLTSPGFGTALVNTLVYSVGGTFGAIVVGLVAALALRRPFRGRGLIRAALLLPYVAPIVAATFVWKTLLNPEFGAVNTWGTTLLGWDEPIAFLTSGENAGSLPVSTAMLTVVVFEAWRSFPFAFLFLTARMEAIPAVLDEAAEVDGASPLQRFWHIVLPQLLPTIAVLTVLRFIWTFNDFDAIYLLTGGGSGTEVLATQVYSFLTARGDVGASAAVAMFMAAVLAVGLVVYLKFFAERDRPA